MSSMMPRVPRLVVAFVIVSALALASGLNAFAASDSGTPNTRVTLAPNGGWAAYHFTYPGDNSELDLRLMINGPDPSTEVANAVTLDVYGPDSPPPGGTPIGEAIWTAFGERDWQFNSDTAGDYVIVVHNWDPNGEPVSVTLSSLNPDTGMGGPALNFVSAGQ
ncbi:MAG: hypothetical protein KIT87_06210 [Anaerolineae bacterium]|nr:hypothetical protein [Anaerolineae bacterium]